MKIHNLFAAAHHPLVISPEQQSDCAALCDYLAANVAQLQQRLYQHGAILLRGFQIPDATHFTRYAMALGAQPFSYIGGNSPRTRVQQDVFTSTEYPASEVISLHHEMSYLPVWPRRLFFYCQQPARSGGQTSLANSDDVLQAIGPDIAAEFQARGICYIRNFQSGVKIGKSWQATYGTEDRAQVEQILQQQNSSFLWGSNGSLQVRTRRDAFASHPATGKLVWFNQAEQWHPSALPAAMRSLFEARGLLAHHCEFGDGSPIPDPLLHQVRSAMNAQKLLFDWQQNDVLLLDNMLMMHGREAFQGQRSTLAYLSST